MDEMPNHRTIIITGIIGIAAAILVGTGEFMLHFSPAGDYADDWILRWNMPGGSYNWNLRTREI